jgi:multidrug efflux pump subunit AcrB
LREQGNSMHDAVVEEAAVLRQRPILIITGVMFLAAIPLALAPGTEAESQVPSR